MVILAMLAPGAARAEPTAEEIRAAVETVLSDGRYQTELPNGARPEEPEIAESPPWRFEMPDGLSGLARLLMWILVGAGAVLAAIFVITEISSFRRRPRGGASRAEHGPAPGDAAGGGPKAAGTSLDEADRLAREGRHADALHMLLLDCIAQLRRLRFEGLIAPSLTSREVASRLSLPEQSANALSTIVSAVELTHFGGRVPDESDYLRCRQSYLQVARDHAEAA